MSESMFEGMTNPDVVEKPAPSLSIPTELEEFVGEGKKYKSVDDALKSVPHAQTHIQRLEAEAQALKDELAKRRATEELLEELKGSVRSETTPPVASVDPNAINSLVESVLTRKEQERVAKENQASIIKAFTDKFGEKAEEEYNKVAQQSGLDLANLNKLSASSPKAVLRLAGIDFPVTREVPGKTASSVNTEAFPAGSKQQMSARVTGTTTKDLVNAWKAAGELVKQNI